MKQIIFVALILLLYFRMKDIETKLLPTQILIVFAIFSACQVFSFLQKQMVGNGKAFLYTLYWLFLIVNLISIEWLGPKVLTNITIFLLPIPLLLKYRVRLAGVVAIALVSLVCTQLLTHGNYLLSSENFATLTYPLILFALGLQALQVVKEEVLTT